MSDLLIAIVAIAIVIGIFLICRELVCWYWKINKHISLMEENNELLRMLVAQNSTKQKEAVEMSKEESKDEVN
ncbi:MAG: hypothetical protein ACRCTF_06170 [Bacteroidales bacterium]